MVSATKHQQSEGLPLYSFVIDSTADLAKLPTTTDMKDFGDLARAGSTACTPDLNHAFILSPSGEWIDATS